jgi:hypothetical protein
MTYYPGQRIYVVPCGHGPFGETRVANGLNPATGQPFEPEITLGWPAVWPPVRMVNTAFGPVAAERVKPLE